MSEHTAPALSSSLTQAQKKLLDEIQRLSLEKGFAPSYRELMKALGYTSTGPIHRLISELQKKGYLQRNEKRAWRSLAISQGSTQTPSERSAISSQNSPLSRETADGGRSIEIIGTVSGSKPPELFLHPHPLVLPSQPMSPYPEDSLLYGLVIQDTSFIPEHLLPGDIIIVEPTEEIHPGELVLATAPNESIIGHFFDEGDVLRFKSSPYSYNTSFFHAKKVSSQDTQVWGVIISSLRGFIKVDSLGM